ncbi:MAG: hypothetical protein ABSF55_01275 [Candidatus Staskawiczbacteria bacterium]|jgi:hypothetical protein
MDKMWLEYWEFREMKWKGKMQNESDRAKKLRSLIDALRETLIGDEPLLAGPVQTTFTQSYIKLLEKEFNNRIRNGG